MHCRRSMISISDHSLPAAAPGVSIHLTPSRL
jgi:hypothetical protein